jgi:hypothetical protein
VTELSDTLQRLRIRALVRIARKKTYPADEATVIELAQTMDDASVIRELYRGTLPFQWFRDWIGNRGS